MGMGEFSRPGTGRSRLDSADSMLGPHETPVYERRLRREVQALNVKTETVKDEWGFEDKRTAQAMMARQARFQKAKRDKKRRNRLKDPEYKYKLLMRRVREAKEREERGLVHSTSLESARGGAGNSGGKVRKGPRRTSSSSSSSRPPKSSRSAVQRDRARHRKARKHVLPAWALQPADQVEATSRGGSRGSVASSHTASATGEAMFQVNSWAGDGKGEDSRGAAGDGLSSWGAHRPTETVLPPIGL